jgi:transcriptional regulator with XRE-family HTH domain
MNDERSDNSATPVPTMADLINHLFDKHRRIDGREYTNSEVCRVLGGQLDPSYLGRLRKPGGNDNPTKKTLLLLCQFFKVKPTYFFPELEGIDAPEETEHVHTISVAARSPKISPAVRRKLDELLRALEEEEGDSSEEG